MCREIRESKVLNIKQRYKHMLLGFASPGFIRFITALSWK